MGVILNPEKGGNQPLADLLPLTFSLGLQGFPPALNLLESGHAYSLTLSSSVPYLNFISTILSANLQRGTHCALLTPTSPQIFLRRCGAEYDDQFPAALQRQQLLFLSMVGDYTKNLARFGSIRFLRELSCCGVKEKALLIIDQAERLFSLHQQQKALEQLRDYQQWLSENSCTALLVFSRLVEDAALAASHRAVTDLTKGSLRIDPERCDSELWVDFWPSSEGMITERRIVVGNQQPKATVLSLPRNQFFTDAAHESAGGMEEAPDNDQIYYIGDVAVPASLQRTGNWRKADSLMGLVHATRQARAASVLIAVRRDTEWLNLAHAIHIMRTQSGQTLRIVILDPVRAVRYQHEALLLQAGANLVVHDAASISRLPLLLESLRAQFYSRASALDFDEVVASFAPPQIKGYLRPLIFKEKVHAALKRASVLSVPCALIVLKYPPLYALASSLTHFKLSRDGDLLTTTSTHCYIFLYGCLMNDLQGLLPRLIGLHDKIAVDDIFVHREEAEIIRALQPLAADMRSPISATDCGYETSFTPDRVTNDSFTGLAEPTKNPH